MPDTARTSLPAIVAAAEQHIQPASPQAFAVAMKPFVDWLQRYGVIPLAAPDDELPEGSPERGRRRKQIADIVRGYREDLGDLPADVLAEAVKKVVGGYRYNSLPKPGDFRTVADAEMRERNDRLLRLRTAAMVAERQAKSRAEYSAPRERTPEEIAAAAAMVAQVSRIDAAPKAMPTERSDLHPEDDDRRAAILRVQQETRGLRRIPKPWEARQ